MLKIAVIGAGTLLGRELVDTLEPRECSVLPLSHGPTTVEEELSDVVMFAPSPALLEEIELVILAETPQAPELLEGFQGAILDLRANANPALPPGTSWICRALFMDQPRVLVLVLVIIVRRIDQAIARLAHARICP